MGELEREGGMSSREEVGGEGGQEARGISIGLI